MGWLPVYPRSSCRLLKSRFAARCVMDDRKISRLAPAGFLWTSDCCFSPFEADPILALLLCCFSLPCSWPLNNS